MKKLSQLTLKTITTLAVALSASVAFAKLPALSDEAKAKAAETAAKTAWSGKVDGYLLCKSQDKTAMHYRKSATNAKPATATPPCADPGPFVMPVPAAAAAPVAAPAAAAAPAKKS